MHSGCPADGCVSAPAAESAAEALLDAVMLQLRLGEGLDLDAVAAGHGAAAAEAIRRAVAQHAKAGRAVLEWGVNGEARCRLADPEGFLTSNDIISDVFAALSP